jgi:hypothetical protein
VSLVLISKAFSSKPNGIIRVTIQHLVIDLQNLIETTRGSALTQSETFILTSMTRKSLDSNDALYNLILTRGKGHLSAIINGDLLDESLLLKHGLLSLKKEIEILGNKCKQFLISLASLS